MFARTFDIADLSAAQIEYWNAQLSRSRVPSPFLSYAFCRAVQETRGQVRVACIDQGDGTIGLLPFQLLAGRGILGHAEKVGGTLSDMFGIVGTSCDLLDADMLLRSCGLSALRFDHAVADWCPFPCLDSEHTPGVRVRMESFEGYMKSLRSTQKDFVKTVERAGRKLEREIGKLSFVWHSADAERNLDVLIERKRQQYLRTGKPDGFRSEWRRLLLYRLLREPESSLCRPVLSTLSCNGTWLASNLALACGETLHIWFPVYNPTYKSYGPGHILFLKIFEWGSACGMRWFDFGEGEAAYKSRFGGDSYNLWKGVIRRTSVGGQSERVLQSLGWRVAKWNAKLRRPRRLEMPSP